ncbi:hypothetical protein SEA_JERA_55 [Microbacterium phage Jera]
MSAATELIERRLEELDAEVARITQERQALREAVKVLRRAENGALVPRSIDDAFDEPVGRPAPRPIKDSPQA